MSHTHTSSRVVSILQLLCPHFTTFSIDTKDYCVLKYISYTGTIHSETIKVSEEIGHGPDPWELAFGDACLRLYRGCKIK